MFRTTIGLSFMLVLGGLAACSSKSTNDGKGSGGNGAVLASGGTTAGNQPGCVFSSDCKNGLLCDSNRGVCVTCRNSDDCGSNQLVCVDYDCVDRSTASSGGAGGRAGTGGTTGTATGGTTGTATGGTSGTTTGGSSSQCTDTLVCVDATHASTCNPATGVVNTFSCIDDGAAFGITSTACVHDATNGDGCDGTFADAACEAGADAFAYCYHSTQEEFFNVYVNCFQNNNDGHTVIPCFATYVTTEMKTDADCLMAEDTCLAGLAGAGGAGP